MTQTIGSPAMRMEPRAIILEIFQRLALYSFASARAGLPQIDQDRFVGGVDINHFNRPIVRATRTSK